MKLFHRLIIEAVLGMFLLLPICLMSAACSSKVTFGLNWSRLEKTRESIEDIIDDPGRRASMLAVIDAYKKDAEQITEEITVIRREIVEINRDYDTTREGLQALYDQLADRLDQMIVLARDLSMEMRTICSEAEWERIFRQKENWIIFPYQGG